MGVKGAAETLLCTKHRFADSALFGLAAETTRGFDAFQLSAGTVGHGLTFGLQSTHSTHRQFGNRIGLLLHEGAGDGIMDAGQLFHLMLDLAQEFQFVAHVLHL